MTVAEANGLREAILAFPDLKAYEVAAKVGCAVTTVYKVRRNPKADGRSKKRRQDRVSARMRWLREQAEEELTIDDLVEVTPESELITGLGPRPVVEGDPYADRAYDGYDLARTADPGDAAPEIGLIRSQIRQTANQIHAKGRDLETILVLQEHLNGQIDTMVAAMRANRSTSTDSDRRELYDEGIEAGWTVQGGGER